MAALASRMAEIRQDDLYLAGLWRNTLLQDLAWQIDVGHKSETPPTKRAGPPSWSWASMNARICWSIGLQPLLQVATVEAIDCLPDGPANLGSLRGNSSITLRTSHLETKFSRESDPSFEALELREPHDRWFQNVFIPDCGTKCQGVVDGEALHFLPLVSKVRKRSRLGVNKKLRLCTDGIVVKLDEGSVAYRRVGLSRLEWRLPRKNIETMPHLAEGWLEKLVDWLKSFEARDFVLV